MVPQKVLLKTLLFLSPLLLAEGKSLKTFHDELGTSRISHGGRDASGEVPPESLLISHLSESSNEISSERFDKFDYTGDSYGANGDKAHRKGHSHSLPLYLELIDSQLKAEGEEQQQRGGEEEPSGPLIRAWFPSRISRSFTPREPPSSFLFFAQNTRHPHLRDFGKAEFILSLKAPGSLAVRNEDLLVRLQIGQEIVASKVLPLKTKDLYFTLNITSFLTSYLQSHSAPSEVTFNFTLSSAVDNSSNFFLDEIFDTEEEKPGIILFYKEINFDIGGLSSHSGGHRSKRSVASVESPQNSTNQIVLSNSTSSSPLSNSTTLTSNSSSSTTSSTSTLPLPDHLNLCRRVDWSVSVEDIDWGEVVSHKKLDLGYCAGDCPFPLENEHYNFTLHSYFLDKYKRNRHSEIPSNFPRRSCCIPLTYNSIRVWVEEEENVYVFAEYDNVLVTSCGCR